jgi:S1-C subfamily serine protease
VTPNGPAARAGIKAGDVITEFAGTEVKTYDEMVKVLKEQRPYAEVEVKVRRPAKTGIAVKDKDTDDKDKDAKPETEADTVKLKVVIGFRAD